MLDIGPYRRKKKTGDIAVASAVYAVTLLVER